MTASSELRNHYMRQMVMLESAFDKCNDAAWAHADQNLKGVRQWMYHILETVEFYLGDRSPGDFPWGSRFAGDWENPESIRAVTFDQMREYLEEVKNHTDDCLGNFSDEDLLQPETVHKWAGKVRLGKLLYLLRHTQQHIGDINRVLRMNGCEALDWK